jgi:lipid-A-disaccharide synthase
MVAQGMELIAPLDDITVMGFDGLWSKLGSILRLRAALQLRYKTDKPTAFIGIDAPDFNLKLEVKLRGAGVKTVHYVSPTVWAWREYRLKTIKRACDLMLTLFPFEEQYYQKNNIPVTCVGHPLASELSELSSGTDAVALRESLGAGGKLLIAIMPGSRRSEIDRLGGLFVDFVQAAAQRFPNTIFAVPVANQKVGEQLKDLLMNRAPLPLQLIDSSQARNLLITADFAVLASGTAALEAALVATPMIVSYKVSWLAYLFAQMTARVKHVSMPNHLMDVPLVPELLQGEANLKNLLTTVVPYLENADLRHEQSRALSTIAPTLQRDSGKLAALAIQGLLNNEQ